MRVLLKGEMRKSQALHGTDYEGRAADNGDIQQGQDHNRTAGDEQRKQNGEHGNQHKTERQEHACAVTVVYAARQRLHNAAQCNRRKQLERGKKRGDFQDTLHEQRDDDVHGEHRDERNHVDDDSQAKGHHLEGR